MEGESVIFFLFSSSLALIIVVVGFILFLSMFFKAKQQAYLKEQEAKLNYQKELNKAHQEIQVETLNNIGRELHDNIGQLLTVTRIHAENIAELHPSKETIELSHILDETVREVRNLSRSLNADRLGKIGLTKTLKLEAERINKLAGIEFKLTFENEPQFQLDENRAMILFRIIQEFIANTLKYSRADTISFNIEYAADTMKITGEDNGIGFDINDLSSIQGTGVLNMRNRAQLIGASFHINSILDKGTQMEIIIHKATTDDHI